MGITMNQRTFTVELYQGDDLERLAELSSAATKVGPPGKNTTALEDGEYAAAAQAHDDFLAEAKTRAVKVELKPMLRKDYQQLQVDHPPREDDPSDQAIGANSLTFIEPLLMASIVGPPMSDAERQEFLDSLNNAQFTHLADEALTINRVVFAPKAPLLGSGGQSSGGISDSPDPSA
jgi:hypothetical protein